MIFKLKEIKFLICRQQFFKNLLFFSSLILLLFSSISFAQNNPPEKINFEDNSTVIFWPDQSSKLTSFGIWVKTGTLNETPKNAGISHFIEHLVFKGTFYKSGLEIVKELESLGGDINGLTSTDFTCFHLTIPAEFSEKGAEILLEMVSNPLFDEEDIEAEKKVIFEEIIRQDEVPQNFLRKLVYKNFFRNHPYSLPVLGTTQTIENLSRNAIIEFYNNHYQKENIVFVVTGNFEQEKILNLIKQYFPVKEFKKNIAKNKKHFTPPLKEEIITILRPTYFSYITIGLPAPSVESPDSYVFDIILKILAGGKTGRLVQLLKEKKELVSEITADYTTRAEPGIFTIEAIIKDSKNIEEIISTIKEEIKKLALKPCDSNELEKAKDMVKTEYLLNLETTFEKMFVLGYFETISSYLYGINYLEKIEKVTAPDIQKAVSKYLLKPAIIGIIKPEIFETPNVEESA